MDTLLKLFENPLVVKLVKLALWILVIIFSIALLRKFLKKRIEDTTIRYKAQKGV